MPLFTRIKPESTIEDVKNCIYKYFILKIKISCSSKISEKSPQLRIVTYFFKQRIQLDQ